MSYSVCHSSSARKATCVPFAPLFPFTMNYKNINLVLTLFYFLLFFYELIVSENFIWRNTWAGLFVTTLFFFEIFITFSTSIRCSLSYSSSTKLFASPAFYWAIFIGTPLLILTMNWNKKRVSQEQKLNKTYLLKGKFINWEIFQCMNTCTIMDVTYSIH